MKLQEFAGPYGDFYVPTSVVKVSGKDVVRDLFLSLTSVSVDLKLEAASRFSFTVAGAFDWKERDFVGMVGDSRLDLLQLFGFGAPVEIALGYGEPSRLKPVLKGIVTEVATKFAESGAPELNVSGYDALFGLGLGASTREWVATAPSGAVREVAGANSLPVQISGTDAPLKRIDQNKESDQAFVERMAGLARATFYMRGGTLHFGPRRTSAAAGVELVWGQGLSSFSPRANLAKQVTSVEVHGWSAALGKHIVGKAHSGDEEGVDGKMASGAKWTSKAIPRPRTLAISAALHTQEEADARAKAILQQRSQEFLTADGECIGLPDLLPDSNVAVSGVGRSFGRTYYVTQATHSIDSSGYRTRFQVQEPGI
jgi:phage protein D